MLSVRKRPHRRETMARLTSDALSSAPCIPAETEANVSSEKTTQTTTSRGDDQLDSPIPKNKERAGLQFWRSTRSISSLAKSRAERRQVSHRPKHRCHAGRDVHTHAGSRPGLAGVSAR